MSKNHNIVDQFYQTAKANPDWLAISVGKQEITYGDLANQASRLATKLRPNLKTKRVGILGSRSIAAYIGIIGAAWAGATYVPLNLKWPQERLIALMRDLQLDALIVDATGSALMTEEVISEAPNLIFRSDDAADFEKSIGFSELPSPTVNAPVQRTADELGYIVFTSGSTGMPKGVMVSCDSLAQYLNESEKWTQLTSVDRIAEAHDITFDLSVHNMFLAWRVGASLHLMSALDMLAPQAFIRKREISVWMSVPTIVNNLRRAGKLSTGIFPSLRLSIFCGEPLAMPTVLDWADAASNSVIENIYGPTECTIVCTRQRLTDPAIVTEQRGILAIGPSYDNFEITLCDESGSPVQDGQTGEIALASSQLSDGYFNAPDQTANSFRIIDGKRWYYTGDLGYRDENGILHHMGRTDNQIKMKGNRIELEEVETHLRRACENELATVVAWPLIEGIPQGLVGFSTNNTLTESDVRGRMLKSLPEYMVPARIITLPDMPRNINDKVDRKALFASLEIPDIEAPSLETPLAANQNAIA